MQDFRCVHACHRYILKIFKVPVLHSFIGRAACQRQGLGIVLNTRHLMIWAWWMLRQFFNNLSCVHLPYLKRAAYPSWCYPSSIGRYGNISNHIGMLLEGKYCLWCTSSDVPYLDIWILRCSSYHVRWFLINNTRNSCLMPLQHICLHFAQWPNINRATFSSRE